MFMLAWSLAVVLQAETFSKVTSFPDFLAIPHSTFFLKTSLPGKPPGTVVLDSKKTSQKRLTQKKIPSATPRPSRKDYKFAPPVPIALDITSGFGSRVHPVTIHAAFHNGVDFAAPLFTPVLATSAGTVVMVGQEKNAGNYIEIRHLDGWVSRYMHLSAFRVRKGMHVEQGSVVALSGVTGRTTGPHLHFELWHEKRPINPALLLAASNPSLSPARQENNGHHSPKQMPQILFLTEQGGRPSVVIKAKGRLIYAREGEIVLNNLKVIRKGTRFHLQPIT